ncbi:hypothetical protein L7F22_013289 [Adiantum nelumboides]|nr:hypothetical protein [Adiantum nelumboides]
MNTVRADLEDKAETFTQALVDEALISHLEDLENADDEEEVEDEDKDDQASTLGHLGKIDKRLMKEELHVEESKGVGKPSPIKHVEVSHVIPAVELACEVEAQEQVLDMQQVNGGDKVLEVCAILLKVMLLKDSDEEPCYGKQKWSMLGVTASWKAQYPKQTRFFFTQHDLHEEYGLSLEGKLYQHLFDEDVTDEDWLAVFTKKREKGVRIFLNMVRLEYEEEFAGSSDMPYVATVPPEVPNVKVDPTQNAHTIDTDMHSDDQSTPDGRESSSLASDKTLHEEGSHVAIDKTPAAEVEPSQQTVGEPQPKEEPMEDVDDKMTDFVAQEGVEAVQRMVQGDADPDFPIFLSDMVKKSRKQKKHVDARQSKNTQASEMNRSKQQSIKAEKENDGGTSSTHGKAMSEEVPKSPPPAKKTPKKSTPLQNPSIISHPPKPCICKKLWH